MSGVGESSMQASGEQAASGLNAVEIAARKGFGPLSALAEKNWHGDGVPCVSCGQLVRRSAKSCGWCGEVLSDEMQAKMRAYAGPWFVLEHIRPFPGVTAERLVRQIRRGVLMRSTIVRGPTTHFQWRFAGETPGLSKFLGCCWACGSPVAPTDTHCTHCRVELGDLADEVQSTQGSTPPPATDELRRLAEAAESVDIDRRYETGPPRIGSIRVSWVIAAILVIVMGILFAVVQLRSGASAVVKKPTTTPSKPISHDAVQVDSKPAQ